MRLRVMVGGGDGDGGIVVGGVEGMRWEMEGLRDVGVDGGLVVDGKVMALGECRGDVVRVVVYAVLVSPAFDQAVECLHNVMLGLYN